MKLAIATSALLFVAWILLLLVSLSTPILKDVALVKVHTVYHFREISGSVVDHDLYVKFGIWGRCFKMDIADWTCRKSTEQTGIDSTLERALVVHPVACTLVFVAFVVSLCILRCKDRGFTGRQALLIVGSVMTPAVLTTILGIMDVVWVSKFQQLVNSDAIESYEFGNAIWMSVGAAVVLWCSSLSGCIHAFKQSRYAHERKL
ncbi:hypothetical protein K474DRAFT_19133 [Panus rudis PR-1116 ss-1]|nr:hypothetical protein K474DRAFT_19133 [Panus rudis PR-1116 ss-1]